MDAVVDDAMNRRRLGRTNLEVSEISLGTVEIGLDYGIPVAGEERLPSRGAAERLLNCALDLGCNLIDTARAYGASEEIIGHALKSRRHEYTLATKVLHYEQEGLDGAALRRAIEGSVAESLHALQTDVLDIVHVHSATVEVIRRGEIAAILQDLRQQGYLRFIGATTYSDGGVDSGAGGWQVRLPADRLQPARPPSRSGRVSAGAGA